MEKNGWSHSTFARYSFAHCCHVVGSVILIFAFKYLFTPHENNNDNIINNDIVNNNENIINNKEQVLKDLSLAFPSIPLPVICDQLERNQGDVELVTDALLQIYARYSHDRERLNADQFDKDEVSINFEKEMWEGDKDYRNRLLAHRRKVMLEQAKE